MTNIFLILMITSVIFSEFEPYKKYSFNMTILLGLLALACRLYETMGGF